jgi:hypothetical protein
MLLTWHWSLTANNRLTGVLHCSGCLTCDACHGGNYHYCSDGGVDKITGIYQDGGWAEFCVVPTDQVHKLPKNISLQQGKKNCQLLSSNWFFSSGFVEKMLSAIFVSPLDATEYRRKMVVVVGKVIKYHHFYQTLNFNESELHLFNFPYNSKWRLKFLPFQFIHCFHANLSATCK